ncbi:AAA family ATPase [Methanosarcina sp. KYL-1]|uniref:UvrD-helicase domain-containing protein n=1 Tax=Methanosarcina sp. KYL-1 TaxID=2602068 RepID=UPI0021017744|nr:UvrD-helicase domain-containing protein [Methanosarcina sp. KYL-1]MCQ1535295.1 AAA family ATPase [Methanosarcina sp. KYL-1]
MKFSEGVGITVNEANNSDPRFKIKHLLLLFFLAAIILPDFVISLLIVFLLSLVILNRNYLICYSGYVYKILRSEKESISEEVKENIEKTILDLSKRYESYKLRKETYLTFHEKEKLINTCQSCLDTCSIYTHKSKILDEPSKDFLGRSVEQLTCLLNEFKAYDNEDFIQERIQKYDFLFQKSPFPLDDSQKRSIVIDDTHNLVVAGAGSGKTEVLITRAAYLTERAPDGVDAKKILILAFQNKAAGEVKNRLGERFGIDAIEVRTFHSLGKKILEDACKNSGKEIPELKFSGYNFEKEFSSYINSLFNLKKTDGNFQKKILDYMKLYHDDAIVRSKDDFEEKEEFYKYMKGLTYTALDGTKVKSEAERAILNFFLSHNLSGERIRISYEHPAEWMAYTGASGEKKIPRPDFFFPDYDIYLEHWAIDRDGNVPDWFEGENASEEYRKSMAMKIGKFSQQDKYSLVETTYYEFKETNFEKTLTERLTNALKAKYPDKDFEFTPAPYEQLVNRLSAECRESVKGLSFNIGRFITIAKTYNLSPKKIEHRLLTERWSAKQKMFASIASDIYEIYENELRNENKIDFSDMINLAVKELKENTELCKDSFNQILIDEYQDISAQRYELIRELMRKNEGCKLFCVGDDWQSIMGFSGSNLDFFVNFHEYFDHPARTDLSINYRSCKSIVDTGAEIIVYNKGSQIKKETFAKNNDERPIRVYISDYDRRFPYKYHSQITRHCVDSIKCYLDEGYEAKDILLLSRIGKNIMMQKNLREYAEKMKVPLSFDGNKNPNKVPFMTVHRSKGLQAKVVFLLDVVEGMYGFPCELENPDIFEPATHSSKKDRYQEERRLFYVAVTRAMSDLIIYTQKDSVSKFINEIENKVTICELK